MRSRCSRVAGANVSAIPGGRQVGQWIIGTALGLYFTPAVVREVVGWWPLLAVGAVFAIGLGYAAGIALAHLASIDRTTAIFASVPGGAAEMSVLGERFGARVDRVASAQSLRLIIVVTTVPTAYALLGVHGADPYVPGIATFSTAGLCAAHDGDGDRRPRRNGAAIAERLRAWRARRRDSADGHGNQSVGDARPSRPMQDSVFWDARSVRGSSATSCAARRGSSSR